MNTGSSSSFPAWQTIRVILALMLREMSSRYGRSAGGYLWAVLEPLGSILVMAYGFSLFSDTPPLGHDFMLFYATGFLPFSIYHVVLHTTSWALPFSRPLLFYPAVTWVDAIFARFLLSTLTQVFVATLIFASITLINGPLGNIIWEKVALAILFSALLGLGIGVLNGYLLMRIGIWEAFWAIINRPLFFISGIFYLYEDLPHNLQEVLYYNPLIHLSGLLRTGFYPNYRAEYVSLIYLSLFILLPLLLGLILLKNNHKDLLSS